MTAGAATERTPDLERLYLRSLEVIRENQHGSGAYAASPGLLEYRFSWLRDGAFIADAMSRAGEVESAEAFFGWCARVVEARSDRIERLIARHRAGDELAADEHLHCRYTADGSESPEPWSNFQLDGYGSWVWALAGHVERHGTAPGRFLAGAGLSLRYAAEFWAEPCYDWWEERWGRHVATIAAVYGGLTAAESLPGISEPTRDACARAAEDIRAARAKLVVDGRLAGEVGDARLDASLLSAGVLFGLFDPADDALAGTVDALESTIAHGGVHRYPGDEYYGGGEWLILAALLGLQYAETGREADAWAQLVWVAVQARENGDLPEQVETHLETPDRFGHWRERWGPSASPLLWSHAWFVLLARRLGAAG